MPHPTVAMAGVVYGSAAVAHLAQEKYRRDHPVPSVEEWAAMWVLGSEHDRAIMQRWSDRWLYPRGKDRRAMDRLYYRAVQEPHIQARIAHLERAVGIGAQAGATTAAGPGGAGMR